MGAGSVSLRLRRAEPRDAAAIAAIHNQGIEDRSATFETEPRTPDDVRDRIADLSQPFWVAERDGDIVAWAGITRPDPRENVAGVGEYTIYVARQHRGQGSGRPLLEALCDDAAAHGYWKLIGRIFTTNESSLALARRCGFYDVGIHRRHGLLDGEWKDVLVVEKLLT